jgi:hypothetical protein
MSKERIKQYAIRLFRTILYICTEEGLTVYPSLLFRRRKRFVVLFSLSLSIVYTDECEGIRTIEREVDIHRHSFQISFIYIFSIVIDKMNNVVLTSASQIGPNSGNPLNPQPVPPLASEPVTTSTIEALVSTPLEPVEQSNVDGNVQAHVDLNYQPHDVALATAKANGHPLTNGLTLGEHHKMEIDDGYEHPDKAKSCCSMLNKLFLALAIVCFALFLCSIAFIVANLEGVSLLTILLFV